MRLSTIGQRIGWLADQVGSQTELARLSGIQRRAITRYISEENQPRVDSISAIADACGVTPEWVTNGGPMPEVSPSRGLRSRRVRALHPHEAEDSFRPVFLGTDQVASGPGLYTLSKDWAKRFLQTRPPDLATAFLRGEILLVDTSSEPGIEGTYLARVELDPDTNSFLLEGRIQKTKKGLVWTTLDAPRITSPLDTVLGRIVARLSRA